ncbi:RnfABCDGE type electron transport complex subunit D, partial [Escherichia coli]|uniref:RnfABCDGE type electron transport complex subunit D n=1 Tax=Escherichia coli TaxID=562 RepID=UPI002019D987
LYLTLAQLPDSNSVPAHCYSVQLAAPQIHLLSGATMLGAFFILTDPVTASTTNRGRLIFGALAGLLVWLIRSFGGYPDGVAFAVLLANITVPLIDYYTRPRVYGHRKG